MARPIPHYRQSQHNFMPAHPRRGGGLPPTPTPYPHPLIGRAAYPPQSGWQRWIGDRLGIPEVVILPGVHDRRTLYALLRRHGVRVRRIGYQQAAGCGWRLWAQDTYIRVERYHGLAAEAILRDAGQLPDNG